LTRPSLLFDENLPKALHTALWREQPEARKTRVGAPDAPPIGASDEEVLQFAEQRQWLLVSRDRRTLPETVARHLASGGHTWGVLLVRPVAPLRELAADLALVVGASDRDEWCDVVDWIPFGT
jgi:hypothetical protein